LQINALPAGKPRRDFQFPAERIQVVVADLAVEIVSLASPTNGTTLPPQLRPENEILQPGEEVFLPFHFGGEPLGSLARVTRRDFPASEGFARAGSQANRRLDAVAQGPEAPIFVEPAGTDQSTSSRATLIEVI